MIGLLGGLIAAAALAGCAGTQTMTTGGTGSTGTTTTSSTGGPKAPLTSFKCTLDDDCLITVNVVANPTVPTDCTITVDRELVEMNSRGLSSLVSHLIRWQLDDDSQDANFRFANAPDGIVLKEPNDDPNNKQFFKKERSNKGREYLWRDQNSNNKEFKYIINVFQKNSNPRRHCTLDPRIYNN
jgi:hypothetical protein